MCGNDISKDIKIFESNDKLKEKRLSITSFVSHSRIY